METKKQYVTFKMDFDSGMPHNVKVAESREQAAENIRKAVEMDINTEIADYGEVDEEWKEDLLSQVNRVECELNSIVNDMLNNVAYYLQVAED